ncbi:MAG TPA: hypothetical protein VGM86_05610 [Thermoanaerobaculia bacterium]
MSTYKPSENQAPQPSGSENAWSQGTSPLGDYFTKKYQPAYSIPYVKRSRSGGQDQEG